MNGRLMLIIWIPYVYKAMVIMQPINQISAPVSELGH